MRILLIALIAAGTGLSGLSTNVSNWFNSLRKPPTQQQKQEVGRLVMFIGVDISGSFKDGRYFDDSIHFLARYIYAHLKGYDGVEVPHSLFVGTIGGETKEDVKTLYPIQTFEDRSIEQIEAQLYTIFPRYRVVAFYGAPQSRELGALGIGSPASRLSAGTSKTAASARKDSVETFAPDSRRWMVRRFKPLNLANCSCDQLRAVRSSRRRALLMCMDAPWHQCSGPRHHPAARLPP